MAPLTATGVPDTLVAGDTLQFDVSFPDYPVSKGWSLSMSFVGAGQLQTESGWITNDSAVTWTVTVPASSTAVLTAKPGLYEWHAYMTGSGSYAGQRYTVGRGRIDVRPNPTQAQDGDFQSGYEVELALIQTEIRARLADQAMKASTVRGRQTVLEELDRLYAREAWLKRQIHRQKNPRRGFPMIQRRYHGPAA